MILRLHSFQRCNVPTHTHTHTQEPAVLPFGSLISFFPRVIASALRRPRVPISSSDPPSPPPEIFFTVSILLAIHSKTSWNKPPDADDDHEETLQNLLMHTTTRLHDSAQIARSKCKSCAKNTPKLQTMLDSAQITQSECKFCTKIVRKTATDA